MSGLQVLLPTAILDHDIETMTAIISMGFCPEQQFERPNGPGHITPMCYAAECGFLDGMKLMLDQAADATTGSKEMADSISAPALSIRDYLHHRIYDPNLSDLNNIRPNLCCNNNTFQRQHALKPKELISIPLLDDGCLTPLIAASSNGHLDVVAYLCDHLGEQKMLTQHINVRDTSGHTALLAACKHGHFTVAEYLLRCTDQGAVNLTNIFDQNTLILAVISGNAQLVQLVAEHGAFWDQEDCYEHNALTYAIHLGHVQIIRLIHTECPELFQFDQSKLLELALKYEEVLQILITECDVHVRCYMDQDDNTLLHRAVIKPSSTDIVQTILQHDPPALDKMDLRGNTALSVLLQQNTPSSRRTSICRLLLEAGANPNLPAPPRLAPIFIAVANGDIDLVHILITGGADVTIEDLYYKTPLDLILKSVKKNSQNQAAMCQIKDIIRSLVSERSGESQTHLTHVLFRTLRHMDCLTAFVLDLFAQNGLNLHTVNSADELTLLQASIINNNFEAVKYCLTDGHTLNTNAPARSRTNSILNIYVEHNGVHRTYNSQTNVCKDSEDRRKDILSMLTVAGMNWISISEINPQYLRQKCETLLPLRLQQLCRKTLRDHLGSTYQSVVKHTRDIPDGIRDYLLFSDFS